MKHSIRYNIYLAIAVVFYTLSPSLGRTQCIGCGCTGGFCGTGKHKLVGEKSPDFTLQTTGGKSITRSEFKDKIVLIVFLSTWSDNTKTALPFLSKLNESYLSEGLTIIGVTPETDREAVERFRTENSLPFPVLVNGGDVLEKYVVGGLPDMVLVSRSGTVHARLIGCSQEGNNAFDMTVSLLMNRKQISFQ